MQSSRLRCVVLCPAFIFSILSRATWPGKAPSKEMICWCLTLILISARWLSPQSRQGLHLEPQDLSTSSSQVPGTSYTDHLPHESSFSEKQLRCFCFSVLTGSIPWSAAYPLNSPPGYSALLGCQKDAWLSPSLSCCHRQPGLHLVYLCLFLFDHDRQQTLGLVLAATIHHCHFQTAQG